MKHDLKRAVLSVSSPNSFLLQSGFGFLFVGVCMGEWLLWALGSEEARLRSWLLFSTKSPFPSKPLGDCD